MSCLISKSVPIYIGANNIENYIPKNCFIAKNDFKDYKELYEFLKNISEKEYQEYINNIENFLDSDKFLYFNPINFAENLLKATMPEYKRENAFTENQIKILEKIDFVKKKIELP